MKKILFSFIIILWVQTVFSQNMNNEKLGKIFESVSDSIQGEEGRWQLKIKNIVLFCITDTNYNRMRIVSPVIDAKRLDDKLKSAALIANFHSALDVKYAISDDILWSVFIHPLKELSEAQVKDAIKQVYNANITFGTTFSSTELVFPGNQKKEEKKKEKKLLRKEY